MVPDNMFLVNTPHPPRLPTPTHLPPPQLQHSFTQTPPCTNSNRLMIVCSLTAITLRTVLTTVCRQSSSRQHAEHILTVSVLRFNMSWRRQEASLSNLGDHHCMTSNDADTSQTAQSARAHASAYGFDHSKLGESLSLTTAAVSVCPYQLMVSVGRLIPTCLI